MLAGAPEARLSRYWPPLATARSLGQARIAAPASQFSWRVAPPGRAVIDKVAGWLLSDRQRLTTVGSRMQMLLLLATSIAQIDGGRFSVGTPRTAPMRARR